MSIRAFQTAILETRMLTDKSEHFTDCELAMESSVGKKKLCRVLFATSKLIWWCDTLTMCEYDVVKLDQVAQYIAR